MTRKEILTAVREGIPFLIKMADGEKYPVQESYEIAVGKTRVMVFKDDVAHLLPFPMMTGITYLPAEKQGR